MTNEVEIGVILPAAGSGVRMGGEPKAFMEIAGRPLLQWSLETLLADPRVRAVAVVVPSDGQFLAPAWLTATDPRVHVVQGGATRDESVRSGLRALPAEVDLVIVHDAARPLLDVAALERCVWSAGQGTSAVVGHRAVDTIKEVEGGLIRATPPRDRLWQVQTPQVFPRAVLERAHRRAVSEGLSGTDDASLVEALGEPVRVVESGRWNLKVTFPEDVEVARHLLSDRVRPLRSWTPRTDEEWRSVVDHLRADGLIAYPTGTVYGFGGSTSPMAVAQLARLKRRSAHKPFLILLPDPSAAPELAWTPEARKLAEAFWPGPLTLILGDPSQAYPPGVHGPEGGVAVRVDAHPLVTELLRHFGAPLTSSSANAPGEGPASDGPSALAALEKLNAGGEVWALDGGPVHGGLSSTLVDLTGPRPRLVREGVLSAEDIAAHVSFDD